MQAQTYAESDPHHHTTNVGAQLTELADHLREDVNKVSEPKAQALFETAAEVLNGLARAFEHYNTAEEPGMRRAA
jgi:hypothetical protein